MVSFRREKGMRKRARANEISTRKNRKYYQRERKRETPNIAGRLWSIVYGYMFPF
jgi:hypothetical protein